MSEPDLPAIRGGDEDGGQAENLPAREPPVEVIIDRFMAMVGGSFPPNDQFLDKLDAQQLGKIIDQSEEESKRAHDRFKIATNSTIAIAITGMASLLILILGLAYIFVSHGNAAELREIIALFIGLGAGGLGGYGVARLKRPSEEEPA